MKCKQEVHLDFLMIIGKATKIKNYNFHNSLPSIAQP